MNTTENVFFNFIFRTICVSRYLCCKDMRFMTDAKKVFVKKLADIFFQIATKVFFIFSLKNREKLKKRKRKMQY